MAIDDPAESGLPEASLSPPAPLQPRQQEQDGDVSNITPQELTGYVEKLLKQINDKLDSVSSQIFDKMDDLSTRIEELERSIGELIQEADEDSKTPKTPKTT
ncbi:heat shock factor binding protein 1-domain-containing protein [Mortierella sp. GBAus27b]|nr:hypothetical protein BGX31_007216 [Mortierella sp. GBA43]KAI8347135.1 heat shock factor binding protein 1-domain-containing protein [Mortierella sp. GBAus27b]